MRVLYLDCFAGASGDMILSALADLGVPLEVFREGCEKVELRAEVSFEECYRQGLRGKVLKANFEGPRLTAQEMRARIRRSDLSERAKAVALRALELLEGAEAKVHGQGHPFHELGDPDTLLDLVGAAVALDYLGPEEVRCSPVPLARGKVMGEHGLLPVPTPAVMEILKGVPVIPCDLSIENVTPTGAALLRAMVQGFGGFPEMVIEGVGYGAGSLDPPEMPNLLRAVLGRREGTEAGIWLLEADLDDINPEFLPYLEGRLREAGALDMVLLPNRMKKGRVGVTLRCLVGWRNLEGAIDTLFRESTTLGVRGWEVRRWILERETMEVETPYGVVRVKVGRKGGEVVNIAPEYESCRKIAEGTGVPLKEVYQVALLRARKTLGKEG